MLDVMKTVAPWLVTALTRGGASVATMAASTLAEKFGLSDESVDVVKTVLDGQPMTPEQLLALKQADADFELKMRQAGFTHAESMARNQVPADKVAAGNWANERQYAEAEHDHTARNLAYMYTAALFVVIGLEFYLAIGEIKMSDAVKSTLDTLLGVLITMVIGSKEYFFGSSSRADKQTALITQFAVSPDITVTTDSARLATADYSIKATLNGK